MKAIDLRAAGLSDKPEDWQEPAPEADPDLTDEPSEWGGWDKERKCIANMDGLDYFGQKLAEAQALVDETERLEGEAVARFLAAQTARTEKILAPLQKRLAFLESHIKAYAETHRADLMRGQDSRKKSRTLPSGLRLAWRHDPGGYRWDDSMKESERKAKLLEWAQNEVRSRGPDRLIDHVPVAHVENIKEYIRGTKERPPLEAPPGLKYVEPADVLSITTDADGDE